jgi:GT2 family glycosyltransferase
VYDDAHVWALDVEHRALGLARELEDLRRWWPVRVSRSVERRTRSLRNALRRLFRRPDPVLPVREHVPEVAAAADRSRALAAEGRFAEAEQLLLEARRAHPGAIELLVAHAECAMSAGDLEQAEVRWRRLLAVFGPLAPDEVVARLAFALRMLGRSGDAIAAIDAARPSRTASGSAVVRFELGAALADEGRLEEALTVFVELASSDGLEDGLRLATDSLVLSIARRGALPVPQEFLPERLTPEDHREHRWAPRMSRSARDVDADGTSPTRATFLVDGTAARIDELRTTVDSIASLIPAGEAHDCVVVSAADLLDLESLVTGETRITLIPHAGDTGQAPLEVARRSASGRLVIPVEAGDRVAAGALEHLLTAHADGGAVLVYSDEDLLTANGQHWAPSLKPAWDPDLLLVNPYLGGLVAFDAIALARIGGFRRVPALEPRATSTTTVMWETALRLWFAGELGTRGERVAKVPMTLLHRAFAWPAADPHDDAALPTFRPRSLTDEVVDHLNRSVLPEGVRLELVGSARTPRAVWALPSVLPTISVVVPTRDRRDLLERCFAALTSTSGGVPLELIVVDNGSSETSTLELLEDLEDSGRATIVRSPGSFNFSQLVNRGAEAATGDVLLLLNNDVVALHDGWLQEMLQHALRPEIGAVGALLLHEDGRVQHGGVIIGGNGFAEHAFREWPAGSPGYLSLLRSQRRIGAVTAACLMVRRDLFVAIGGFDEHELPVDLNDIDFCLRLRAQGFEIVWTPFARLLHAEGATRSIGVDQERSAATRKQQLAFLRRWAVEGVLPEDVTYHPGLSLVGLSYRLAPDR